MTAGNGDAARAAAAVYRLAARTFAAEVDPPFYRALLGLSRAPGLAGFAPIDPSGSLEAFAVEYCRLFIGPRPACPPYASARAGGSALGLAAKQAIRAIVDEYGVVPRLPPGAPVADDDHAAVGLALLAELCTTSAAGYARFRAAQLGWLTGFLADVERHSRCGPYGPVATVTAALLHDRACGIC